MTRTGLHNGFGAGGASGFGARAREKCSRKHRRVENDVKVNKMKIKSTEDNRGKAGKQSGPRRRNGGQRAEARGLVSGFDLKMEWHLNKNLVAYLRAHSR